MDAWQILEVSECKLILAIDLTDAYHSLNFAIASQKYCGVTQYYGSDTYVCQKVEFGFSATWKY